MDIIRRHNLTEGLVAVLCTQETCRSIKLAYADKRPRLIFAKRPQRVLYYYSLDHWVKQLSKWARLVNPHSLFKAVLSGAHELRGFHNSDIRESLHGAIRDPRERRRRANAVSRLLKRLHVRGLIARIPRTRRWRVTQRGHSLLGAMIRLHYHGLPLAV